MKIITIVGARPQFIKVSAVSRQILNYPKIDEVIVHTGQHFDSNMSSIFFEEMAIPEPRYNLGIGGKSHGAMTGQMIEKIEQILIAEKPDWVLVYGDTNSTLAAAISASKLHIPLAHVEAGLRSFNMRMPEEINRILTDRISKVLFCPTKAALQNLELEGLKTWQASALEVGDVMYDSSLFFSSKAKKPNIKVSMGDFHLCTIHRAENTDDKASLCSIIEALNTIAKDKQIILPLHPRTKNILKKCSIEINSNIIICDPVGYLEMTWLLMNCSYVFTDSGGLQKEAFFFKKPCITLREQTEWVELVENKYNILVGSNCQKILAAYRNFEFSSSFSQSLYGKGDASYKIVESLL